MKFRIRFADKIVGLLTIFAIVILLSAIFFLGKTHRWFSREYHYLSRFESADGISAGMPILFKGFTIGKIEEIRLTPENDVEVAFLIYDTYQDRMRYGTLLDLVISPIGLGNSMLLHPGLGENIQEEYSVIPHTGTTEAALMRQSGITSITKHADTISDLTANINTLLETVNRIALNLDAAMDGNTDKPLGQILQDVSTITTAAGNNADDIFANITTLSADLARTEGLIRRLIDADGTLFGSLEGTMENIEGTTSHLQTAAGVVADDMPEIMHTVEQLQEAIASLQDVLIALKNNPLLREGVPETVESNSSGTNTRNIDF